MRDNSTSTDAGSGAGDQAGNKSSWQELGVLVTEESDTLREGLSVVEVGGEGDVVGEWCWTLRADGESWSASVTPPGDGLLTPSEEATVMNELGPFHSELEACRAVAFRLGAALVLSSRRLNRLAEAE